MRIAKWMTAVFVIGMIASPSPAAAQVNLKIEFGTHLGPEIGVFAYAPERHGDWRVNYRKWTPITLYDINGHYYPHPVDGARAVVVYTYNGEYFFPPTDRAWVGFDKRYDYVHKPVEVDIARVRPYEPVVKVDAAFGEEVGVFGFSAERAGDWHKNYRRWTPITVYEFHGRYFRHPGPGARPVQIYSYHDELFLPPVDREWIGFDKRFDYAHAPNDEDRRRIHDHP
jgi:hypothetical protein